MRHLHITATMALLLASGCVATRAFVWSVIGENESVRIDALDEGASPRDAAGRCERKAYTRRDEEKARAAGFIASLVKVVTGKDILGILAALGFGGAALKKSRDANRLAGTVKEQRDVIEGLHYGAAHKDAVADPKYIRRAERQIQT